MRGQFGPRRDQNLTLAGAPVDALKQPVLSGMRPEATSRPSFGVSGAETDMSQTRETSNEASHILPPAMRKPAMLALFFERQSYCQSS